MLQAAPSPGPICCPPRCTPFETKRGALARSILPDDLAQGANGGRAEPVLFWRDTDTMEQEASRKAAWCGSQRMPLNHLLKRRQKTYDRAIASPRLKAFSVAAFPLRAADETIGAMFFNYREPHCFNEEEKTLFPILAAIVAASVRDAAHLERERLAASQSISTMNAWRRFSHHQAVGVELI
jgi:transcriptional regulator with GAF, ATPase, and Fis domain